MAVPPIVALKAAGTTQGALQKALTGDLYVKRWTSVKKRPKSKGGPLAVDHELHVNPVGIAIAGAAVTIGAMALGIGAYVFGVRANVSGTKVVRRILDEYEPVYETVTVVDTPAYTVPEVWHWEATGVGTVIGRGWSAGAMRHVTDYPAYTVPAVTHEETRIKTASKVIVMSNRFVPHGTYPDMATAVDKMASRYRNPQGMNQTRQHSATVAGKPVIRHFYEFTVDGSSIGFKQGEQRGSLIEVL